MVAAFKRFARSNYLNERIDELVTPFLHRGIDIPKRVEARLDALYQERAQIDKEFEFLGMSFSILEFVSREMRDQLFKDADYVDALNWDDLGIELTSLDEWFERNRIGRLYQNSE